MSYQFAHLETYSRKPNKAGQSTDFVFDEALRVPSASHHVAHPQAPVLLYGLTMQGLRDEHDQRAAAAKTTNSKGQVRSIRKDQHTLLTVILSHPGEGDVEGWQRDSVEWLKERYGEGLRTVIRHDDEAHPHLHAYILADDMKARSLHPGAVAKAEVMASGADNKDGDNAYRKAMREWQDDYWQKVGMKNGLARIGPGLRRLSRAAWKAEQQSVKAVQQAVERRAELEEEAHQVAAQAKAELDRVQLLSVDVAAREARLTTNTKKVRMWWERTKKERAALKADREILKQKEAAFSAKSKRLGGLLRGVLAGWLEKSPKSIRNEERSSISGHIDALKAGIARASHEAVKEAVRREKAEVEVRRLRVELEQTRQPKGPSNDEDVAPTPRPRL